MRTTSFFRDSLRCSHIESRKSLMCSKSFLSDGPTGLSPSYHKRPLPESLTSLSSKNGKDIFRGALASGGMESYFALAEQFVTQSEPSYCALSSLAMVLNALNFDPKKVWKGPWRWVSEETLQCETEICGHSLQKVRRDGMDFDEFESLARCHGIRIRAQKNDRRNHSETCTRDMMEFRSHVIAVCSSDKSESFIVANFSREVLGQTGDGHFSPIGGYHKEKDLVLIMDVARFKYPPFWVPLEHLWASMAVEDKTTKNPRGYFILSTWNSVVACDDIPVVHKLQTEDAAESHHGFRDHQNYPQVEYQPKLHQDMMGDCPPLIRTWRESKKPSGSIGDTCSVCQTKQTVLKT